MSDINTGSMQHSIVRAFDDSSESLKTTIVNAAVDVTVSAFTDSIAIADVSGNKATTTLVSGKRGLDVNIVDITLDKSNDSVATESVEQSTRVDEASSSITYFGGGGGGGGNAAANSGAGGASGGFVEAVIVPTAAQAFAYNVGTGGAAGTTGTGGAPGAGAAGYIEVTEYYQ